MAPPANADRMKPGWERSDTSSISQLYKYEYKHTWCMAAETISSSGVTNLVEHATNAENHYAHKSRHRERPDCEDHADAYRGHVFREMREGTVGTIVLACIRTVIKDDRKRI